MEIEENFIDVSDSTSEADGQPKFVTLGFLLTSSGSPIPTARRSTGDVSESLGVIDFLKDLQVGKSEVEKNILTPVPSNPALDGPVSKWHAVEAGPAPPNYIPAPPPKVSFKTFLSRTVTPLWENLRPLMTEENNNNNNGSNININNNINNNGKNHEPKSHKRPIIGTEKKPKLKISRSPENNNHKKFNQSTDHMFKHNNYNNEDHSEGNQTKRKSIFPRPPSLLILKRQSTYKTEIPFEKYIHTPHEDFSPPYSPTLRLSDSMLINPEASSEEIDKDSVPVINSIQSLIPLLYSDLYPSPAILEVHEDKSLYPSESGHVSERRITPSPRPKKTLLPYVAMPIKEETEISLLDFLGEINGKTLSTEKKETVSERKYEELPQSIKERCKDLKLDANHLKKHMDVFWRIAYFLYREEFPSVASTGKASNVEKEKDKEKEKDIDASDVIMEKGKEEIKVPAKSLHKLFKGGTLTGEGGYGKVFMARDSSRKITTAIKKVSHDTPKNREINIAEVGFLSSCTHNNIVAYYNTYLNINQKKNIEEIWIVTEYLHGGTLAEAAKNYEFRERQVRFIAKEILQGIKYIHSRGWAHRDLKSPNVMISLDGQIKLIDFGLCADVSKGDRIKLLGSAFWIPPEMINKQPHNRSADIWSYGVCLLELFLRGPPFSQSALLCMFTVALVGLHSVIPQTLSPQCRNFLKQCLQPEPSKRPTAEQLLEDEWIKQQTISRSDFALTARSIFMANTLDSLII